MATKWDTWQLCASVCSKLEVSISLHSVCGSLSVNIYLQCASHLTMDRKVQQRVWINFCFYLGKTGAETYEMLQAAFRESCLSQSKTFEWYFHFKSGYRFFEDNPRPGRPSTSHTEETVAHVQEIIHNMPENCNKRFANEMCDSKICAPSSDSRAEGRSPVSFH